MTEKHSMTDTKQPGERGHTPPAELIVTEIVAQFAWTTNMSRNRLVSLQAAVADAIAAAIEKERERSLNQRADLIAALKELRLASLMYRSSPAVVDQRGLDRLIEAEEAAGILLQQEGAGNG